MNTHFFSPRSLLIILLGAMLVAGCTEPIPTSPATPENREPAKTGADQPSAPNDQPTNKQVAATQPAAPVRQVATTDPVPPPKNNEPAEPAAAVRTEKEEEKEVPPEKDPPIPDGYKPLNKEKNLFFEKTADGKRRVHILAEICQRDELLEVLLCKTNTKEHEAILRCDTDAREIHTALIAAGAKYGSTVRFTPKYKPASGDTIKISLTYYKDGKLLTKPAQYWIQNLKTKKEMEHDWVFAGSRFFKYPDDAEKPPYYCANNGEVISIANFADSMLDLPVQSSRELAELGFHTFTDRIPPLKTKVLVTLEPVAAAKKE